MSTPSPARVVLVLASTFPASETDPVPAFVRDQIIAMNELEGNDLRYVVLAPHDARSHTKDHTSHEHYDEYRFHYARPRGAEQLAGRGIMPALRENRALYFVVPFLFLGEYRAALRLARRLRPVVIYAHWFTPQAIVASWVSRRTGIPFVFTTHASDVDVWRKIPVFGTRIVRTAVARARAMTAVSTRSAGKLARFLNDSDSARVEIIPMGVPLTVAAGVAETRASARAARGWTSSLVLLFLGRLVEKKGVADLLDAVAAAHEELGDWQLVIAGDGPLAAPLAARVAELGLADRVHFVGYVTGEDKAGYLSMADVYVVPSIIAADGDAEGLPVSLLEGLSYGLICVATNESGADDIVTDGRDGYLVPQASPSVLAKALTVAARLSPADRSRMSASARTLAESYAWPVVAHQHRVALIDPILNGGSIAAAR